VEFDVLQIWQKQDNQWRLWHAKGGTPDAQRLLLTKSQQGIARWSPMPLQCPSRPKMILDMTQG
jgi:hypothetical protein